MIKSRLVSRPVFLWQIDPRQNVYLLEFFSSAVTKGQRSLSYTDRAIVRRLSVVRRPSTFLQTTSPLKPLAGFLSNLVCICLRWSSTKFIQIMVILWFFMILWIINDFPLNDISSETTGLIELKFCMKIHWVVLSQVCSNHGDSSCFCESLMVFP